MITCKMHYKQEQNEISQTNGPVSCNMSSKELGVTFVEWGKGPLVLKLQ